MSEAQITSILAHWPACVYLALWATGLGVVLLLAVLGATGGVLGVIGLLANRYDPRNQDRSGLWRSTTTYLTKKLGNYSN